MTSLITKKGFYDIVSEQTFFKCLSVFFRIRLYLFAQTKVYWYRKRKGTILIYDSLKKFQYFCFFFSMVNFHGTQYKSNSQCIKVSQQKLKSWTQSFLTKQPRPAARAGPMGRFEEYWLNLFTTKNYNFEKNISKNKFSFLKNLFRFGKIF